MSTTVLPQRSSASGSDRKCATNALQMLNFFMADMQAGIWPFLGVFLQRRGWTAQALAAWPRHGIESARSPAPV